MRILIIGGNGQLGRDVGEALVGTHEVISLTHDDLSIDQQSSVVKLIGEIKPDWVINTAAMHQVEDCEANPEQAYAVNALGPKYLAEACEDRKAGLIHVSTDYVFDGNTTIPYIETDAPRPLNVYGNTKLSGEHYVLSHCRKAAVARVGGIYGVHPCRAKGGLNFVRLMLKLAAERPFVRVVDDEIVTPTPTAAIAKQFLVMIEAEAVGLFHLTCQGQCSWYGFAQRIFELTGTKIDLQKANPGEFPAKIPRPAFSVLENAHLKKMKLDCMPSWEAGLEDFLKKL